MQPRHDRTNDLSGLIVVAGASHRRQIPRSRESFKQQRRAVVGQNLGRSVPSVPVHHIAAAYLLLVDGDFQYRACAVAENRQQQTAALTRHNGFAVLREIPAHQPVVECTV